MTTEKNNHLDKKATYNVKSTTKSEEFCKTHRSL